MTIPKKEQDKLFCNVCCKQLSVWEISRQEKEMDVKIYGICTDCKAEKKQDVNQDYKGINFTVHIDCKLEQTTIRGMISSYAAAKDDKRRWPKDDYCSGRLDGLAFAFAHVGLTIQDI